MNDKIAAAEILPHVRLMFEIDNPSLEECYRHGFLMSRDGVDESVNPFLNRGKKESELWSQGWWDCFYDEEPMFNLEPTLSTQLLTNSQKIHWSEEEAVNEEKFEEVKGSAMTTVAKIAAVVAGAFLSYQVIDLIA